MTAALKDKDQDVRWSAAMVLGEIKDPRAVEPLIAATLWGNDADVRIIAAKALEKIRGCQRG